MHVDDLQKIRLEPAPSWEITFHELYLLDPDAVANIEGAEPSSVWESYFGQDIFQAKNAAKGLFIDIGWGPHANPDGCFCLAVLPYSYDPIEECDVINWQTPIQQLETRSLDTLASQLQIILQ